MNPKELESISTKFQLGTPIGVATSVDGCRGGSFMWSLHTDKGRYAIKQLAPSIDLKNERIVTKYELSEAVANQFAQHAIRAVSAMEMSGKRLFITDNKGYLIYPWVDGYRLGRYEISEPHALNIAAVIAKLHEINLSVPEMGAPHVDTHSSATVMAAINKSESSRCPFASLLRDNQESILAMNENYLALSLLLLENTVVSHGDLDQLNILWDASNQPILIDWESVRRINPTREIIRASLGWSGFGKEDFSSSIYTNMLKSYIRSGGKINLNHVNAAMYSMVGSMVNWVLFNIDIAGASDVSTQRNTAEKEVVWAVMFMRKLKKLMPTLMEISQLNE